MRFASHEADVSNGNERYENSSALVCNTSAGSDILVVTYKFQPRVPVLYALAQTIIKTNMTSALFHKTILPKSLLKGFWNMPIDSTCCFSLMSHHTKQISEMWFESLRKVIGKGQRKDVQCDVTAMPHSALFFFFFFFLLASMKLISRSPFSCVSTPKGRKSVFLRL